MVTNLNRNATGMPPSPDYVDASRTLDTALSQVTSTAVREVPDLADANQTLLRGAHDVAWLTTLTTPCASRLLSSQILFVHGRHATRDVERLSAKLGGRLVEATEADLPDLVDSLLASQRAAEQTARMLPHAVAPSATPRREVVGLQL